MSEAPSGEAEIFRIAQELGSATIHEASGKKGALPFPIKPISPLWRVAGPAFPVATTPGINVWIHDAIYAAPAGSVLVVDCGGHYEFGYWGAIMSEAAAAAGLCGLVIDGCVRDAEDLGHIGLPVFARGLCISGTGKARSPRGRVGEQITIGEVSVAAGDLVVGDRDGVVVVAAGAASRVVHAGVSRTDEEVEIRRRLRRGERTIDIYGFSE